jgi:capsular polysaccharide biosynthesis protein
MENNFRNGINYQMGYYGNNLDTEEIKNEIEIDVRGLFSTILNRLLVIILIGVLVGGIAFVYTKYFVSPQYVATTKVYILSKQDPDEKTLTTSDISFATYLAKDYEELLTTRPVLEEVKKELNLDTSIESLEGMITVSVENDTRIMAISVTSTDPKLAKKIADKVREVANERLKVIMDGLEPVRSVDEAELPTKPTSPNVKRNTMMGFVAGVGISLLVVIILFILDDTIKTPDDIEKRLGVSVLAAIPLKSEDSNSRRSSYGYGHDAGKSKKKTNNKKIKKKDKTEEKNETTNPSEDKNSMNTDSTTRKE